MAKKPQSERAMRKRESVERSKLDTCPRHDAKVKYGHMYRCGCPRLATS